MSEFTEDLRTLVRRPIHGWVTTLRADGTPHNSVVWVDVDGDDVVFNTAVGRLKERHLRANPTVSISVLDPEDAYHWVSVTGQATITQDGADAMIDHLAKKYLNADSYPFRRAGEVRVTVRVRPEHVTTQRT